MSANVYVDAFNLYYGALRGTDYKWLDLRSLSEKLVPKHPVKRIRYFTARVQSRPDDPQIAQRQQIYLRALETLPGLTVHYGRFLSNVTRLPLANPPAGNPRTVEVLRTEEKGSDVNLATQLLLDAFDRDFELSLIISNDSDLTGPISVVRQRFGLPVGVVNPHPNTSHALRQAASFYRPLRKGVLASSLLPDILTDHQGQIAKPERW